MVRHDSDIAQDLSSHDPASRSIARGSEHQVSSAPHVRFHDTLSARRWTEEDHARLLRMISASELYRCTFFPSGMVRPTVWRAARDLFLEFFRDQPQILNEWKRKGYVSIDADGQWKATAAWASKTSNPIINKLHMYVLGPSTGPGCG